MKLSTMISAAARAGVIDGCSAAIERPQAANGDARADEVGAAAEHVLVDAHVRVRDEHDGEIVCASFHSPSIFLSRRPGVNRARERARKPQS